MRSSSHLALASVWLAMIVSLPATSSAQTATGQITGTVRDSTGAVMSDVKVTVTNQQTGLTRQTTTGDKGDFVIPLLSVGVYVVTGEKAGFKLAVNSDVALTVDQIQRVDIVLDAGNVTETVNVQASAQVLDTGSASVGHTITEKQVTDLPLNGRNFLQLLFLGAGAVETTGEQGGMRSGRRQRDQHHGRPPDVEQLHDRWHREHRHVDRHAGRRPVGRCDRGVQGADDDLLGGVRVQLQPDQPGEQDRHECVPRHRVRVLQERRLGRPELLRRQDLRGAEARSEAVRVRRRRSGAAARLQRPEPDVLPRQLRRDPHRPWRDELLHRADAAGAGGALRHHDHRSAHRPAVSEQHHSTVAVLASSPSSPSATAGSRRRTPRPRRATSRTCGRSRRSRTSSRSAGTRTSGSSAACSSAIPTPATRTRRPRT